MFLISQQSPLVIPEQDLNSSVPEEVLGAEQLQKTCWQDAAGTSLTSAQNLLNTIRCSCTRDVNSQPSAVTVRGRQPQPARREAAESHAAVVQTFRRSIRAAEALAEPSYLTQLHPVSRWLGATQEVTEGGAPFKRVCCLLVREQAGEPEVSRTSCSISWVGPVKPAFIFFDPSIPFPVSLILFYFLGDFS